MTEPVTLTGIGELATASASEEAILQVVEDAAIVIAGPEVVWAGRAGDLPPEWSGSVTVDLAGRAVVPGFVDAHTHLVFGGDRADEFALRMRGVPYSEIAAGGGGIVATVAATRATPFAGLVASARERMRRLLAGGTTTLEVKSGYGLDTETEKALLAAAAAAAAELPMTLLTTFLGAHAVPPEYRSDRSAYVDLVVSEMLPACAPAADFCDVFVEEGAFDIEEARRVFAAAAELGLGARVHAEQLGHLGGARLAAEIGAMSADHLDHADEADAAVLAASGTAAVLVPGASFQLRSRQAPGPELWQAGVTVAIATDCNPGTSYVESMSFVIALAVTQMGLTPEQALWAATRGGALALGLPDRGRLHPGDRADLVVLDAPSFRHLPYRPATNLVSGVMAEGEWVVGDEW